MDLRVQRQNPERPQVESQNLSLPKSLSHLGTKKPKTKQTKKKLAEINCELNSESGDPDLKTNRSKEKEGYSLGFSAANNNSCLLFAGSPAGEAGFPGGTMVKNPPANAGDVRDAGSVPGSGRSLGGGNGNLLQYSCLENSVDRGAW